MTTAISTVLNQSAFSKQNLSMAELFAARLQDLFSQNLGTIAVKSFGTEEESWSRAIVEKIEFTLPNGTAITCRISTPKEAV